MSVHVGDRGRTLCSLCPQGSITINGESYHARSDAEPIEPNCDVIVIDGNHLGLVVRKIIPGRPLPPLSRVGDRISVSFTERVTAEAKQVDAERERRRDAQRIKSRRQGAFLGLVFAIGGLKAAWPIVVHTVSDQALIPVCVGVALVGIIWGVLVCRFIEESLTRLDEDLSRLAFPATCLALLGAVAGMIIGLGSFGILASLALGIVGTVLFGIILPGLALFRDWII